MSYNGWTNRSTWLVNIWYSPGTLDAVEFAKTHLEKRHRQMPASILKDMINMSEINWTELREQFEEQDQ